MHDNETKVAYPRWAWGLVWLGFPLVGAGAFWLIGAVIEWVTPYGGPFSKPLNLIGSVPEPQASIGAMVIGLLAGLVLAMLAAKDALEVHVSGDAVRVQRGSAPERTIGRREAGGVFVDAKHLVVLAEGGAELLREKHDLEDAELAAAFTAHGWPWLTADPYAGQYRRFVDDDPDLPPAANAMLKARAVAVSKDDRDDLAELRGELGKLGVVVRDERKRQYWRLVR